METSNGSNSKFNLFAVIKMIESQVKNTIKVLLGAIAAAAIGEGVLGWGLYWPFLFILFEWEGVYWFALLIGILISVFNGVAVGLPSLFLVVVIGVLSLFFDGRRDLILVMVILSVVANFVFDRLFGLGWNLWEGIAVLLTSLFVFNLDSRAESIHIKYH